MPKKKSVKKKPVKKKVSKKIVKRKAPVKRKNVSAKKKVAKRPVKVVRKKSKFMLVLRNLILFAILFVISIVLYSVSVVEIYLNLFFLLSVIFGFASIALLIVLLIFLFRRWLRK